MKQNKRFILLVVMVLLANCLFAGLASADWNAPDGYEVFLSGLQVTPNSWNGTTALTSSVDFEIPAETTSYNKSAVVETTGESIWVELSPEAHKGGTNIDEKKNYKHIEVPYTSKTVAMTKLESGNTLKFLVKVDDANAATINGDKISDVIVMTGDYAGFNVDMKAVAKENSPKKATITITEIKKGDSASDPSGKSAKFTVKFTTVGPDSITVADQKATLKAGSTLKLSDVVKATANPEYHCDGTVTWSTSNTEIAEIIKTDTEYIKLKAAGKVKIIATSTKNGKTGYAEVEVKAAGSNTPIKTMKFSQDAVEMNAANGPTLDLKAFLVTDPAKDYTANLVWTSSNPAVAFVENGKVTLANNGLNDSTTISVEAINPDGSKVGPASIKVTAKNKSTKLTGITIDPASVSLYYSEKEAQSALGRYDGAIIKFQGTYTADDATKYNWQSNNNKVAVVTFNSKTGVAEIIATGVGSTTITATVSDGDKEFTVAPGKEMKVTVVGATTSSKMAVTNPKTGKSSATLYIDKNGKGGSLKVDASVEGVTWSSKDEKVATVVDGKITAVKAGKTSIVATAADGKTATFGVNVKAKPVTSWEFNAKAKSLKVGQKTTLFTFEPSSAVVTCTYDKEGIVSVNKNGKVTALAAGTVTVTAKSGSKTKTVKITVK